MRHHAHVLKVPSEEVSDTVTDGAIQSIVDAVRAGDSSGAQRLCEQYLQRDPGSSDVILLLALSLQQQGRLDQATAAYAQLTRLEPRSATHWGNYAAALKATGDVDAAERAVQTAVDLAPDDAVWLEQLGILQLQRNDARSARDTLLRAATLAPESPAVRIHAARACTACGDYRADELLQPWRIWPPLDESLQYELADALLQVGDADAALNLLEDLVRRAPVHVPVRLLLANVYERVNRPDDADALLAKIVAGGAGDDPAVRHDIAHQQAQLALRRSDATTARDLLEQSGPLDETDYVHYFALANACDQAGDVAAAMHALKTAHARQIEALRLIAPQRFEPGAAILPRAEGRVAAADYRQWPALKAPDSWQSPVFIVGFPRSGTTLLEQMFDAHPRLQSMDERPFFNLLADQLDEAGLQVPRDIGKFTQRDCDELRKGYLALACSKVPRRWDAQLVDKNPLNMLWLPIIHRLFPEARIILAVRHPCDVILSCYMQNFRAAVLARASESLVRLAEAYVAAMESWLYHAEIFEPQVFVSRYEDLVADAPQQAGLISKFLGLDGADAMLRFDTHARAKGYIATPSYTQVIEPINSNRLNRWHRYSEFFESVLPILQPMLDSWGYAASVPIDQASG